jgi:undecaprenyl-diphosphatase
MHGLLHRPRPAGGFVDIDSNGFPSGHTSHAAAAGLALALLLWPRLTAAGRVAVATLAVALAVGIGFTRVALLAHWPTDVLGGWLLALAVVPIVALATTRRHRPPPAPPGSSAPPAPPGSSAPPGRRSPSWGRRRHRSRL